MKVLGGFLGVDGDDFTATTSNQEDPIQTLEENLQELHVWENSSQGKAHTQAHQVSHPTSQWMCNECAMNAWSLASVMLLATWEEGGLGLLA